MDLGHSHVLINSPRNIPCPNVPRMVSYCRGFLCTGTLYTGVLSELYSKMIKSMDFSIKTVKELQAYLKERGLIYWPPTCLYPFPTLYSEAMCTVNNNRLGEAKKLYPSHKLTFLIPTVTVACSPCTSMSWHCFNVDE